MSLRRSPPQLAVAVRVAVCTAAPLAVGLVLGRLDLGLVASLGAFAAMYFGPDHQRRATATAAAAAALGAATFVGGLVAGHPAWVLPGVSAFAVVLTLVWEYGRFGLPGVSLIVMVCALRSGAPSGSPILDSGLCLAVGVLAIGARLLGPTARTGRPRPRPSRAPRPTAGSVLMAGRTGAALLLTGGIVQLFDVTNPAWALTATVTVVAMGTHTAAAADRALHRSIGTLVGVGVAVPILLVHPVGWSLVAALTLLQSGAQILITRNYALGLVVVTPAALLLNQAVVGDGPLLPVLERRAGETVVGVTVAVLVGYLACRPAWAVAVLRDAIGNVTRAAARLAEAVGAAGPSPDLRRARGVALVRRSLEELETAASLTTAERRAVRLAVAPLAAEVAAARIVAERAIAAATPSTGLRETEVLPR